MKLKILIFICLISFIGQIGFSIYYSIKIVDQNSLINDVEPKLNDALIRHQNLKYQFSTLNSFNRINSDPVIKTLTPVNVFLDLNK